MHVLRHFQQYLCYILVAMFIVSRNGGIPHWRGCASKRRN